jgi:hypothetical protein
MCVRACVRARVYSFTGPLLSRIWGPFQSLRMALKNFVSVRLNKPTQYLESCKRIFIKCNSGTHYTNLSLSYHFVYDRTGITDTLQEPTVHFCARL